MADERKRKMAEGKNQRWLIVKKIDEGKKKEDG